MSRYMRWRERFKGWFGWLFTKPKPVPYVDWDGLLLSDINEAINDAIRPYCDEVPPTKEQPMKAGKFQVFRGTNGAWYWRLRAHNGRIVAASEGYTREYDAKRSCQAVMTAARGARIVD